MKKRWLGIFLTAVLTTAQPAAAFAAPSPNTNVNFDSDDSNGYYDDSAANKLTERIQLITLGTVRSIMLIIPILPIPGQQMPRQ